MRKFPNQSTKYTNIMRHSDGSLNLTHYLNRAQDERANAIQALAQLLVGWTRKQ